MNRNLLAAKLTEMGMTFYNAADELEMSRNTFYSRMSGRSQFTIPEIIKLCDILRITDDSEKCRIFLSQSSQK